MLNTAAMLKQKHKSKLIIMAAVIIKEINMYFHSICHKRLPETQGNQKSYET